MLKPKEIIASAKWNHAQDQVNKAVSVFSRMGVGFSLSDGIVGNYSAASKKEKKALISAADTMVKYQAVYSPSRRNSTGGPAAANPAHYQPLELADNSYVQEKAFIQSKTSMHLRAAQEFIHRINYDARLQSHPNRRSLGLTPEESQEWAATTEAIWRQDKNSKDWDLSRRNNYAQLADMAMRSYLSLGEFFSVIRYYTDKTGRETPISIQHYHPFQIKSPFWGQGLFSYTRLFYNKGTQIVETSTSDYYASATKKGNYIEGGIEYNKYGEEIAIFIAPARASDKWEKVNFRNSKGMTQVIHGFIQEEPGQKRGIPESAYSWHEFMNIRDLARFEMQSARVNATISGTVTADSNAQPNGSQGGMENMGHRSGWRTDEIEPPNTLAPYEDPGYSVREVEGGGYVVQNFTPGYTYKEHSTSRPNVKIPEFIEKNLEFTYPGTYGASVVVIKQRFDNSYNASKGAIDLTWKQSVEYYLKQFSSDYHNVLFPLWLNGKIASGEITAPGWDTVKGRKAWASMSIITPAKPSLNPLAEAKAGIERVNSGFSNRELEAQQQTGTSYEENVERLTQENDVLQGTVPIVENPVENMGNQEENEDA